MRRLRPFPASPEILEKIEEKHGICFDEVGEVFSHPHMVLRGPEDAYGERRYASLGRTVAGRYLFVVYVIPQPGIAKVITARDMVERERRRYQKSLGRRGKR